MAIPKPVLSSDPTLRCVTCVSLKWQHMCQVYRCH